MGIFYTVPQSHCVIVERFGKFARIQREGIRFKLPWMEKVRYVHDWGDIANKKGYQIELTEQQLDTPKRRCHTKDNAAITVNAIIYWRITDPRKALYEVDVLPNAMREVALNSLRSNVGNENLDAILTEREHLNEKIALELSETAEKWGVQFTRVEIQEIETDEETSRAMRQQMDAERERRSMVARAEGQAEAEVKVAEAEKNAAIIRAEGHAKALEIIGHAEQQYLMTIGMGVADDQAAKLLMAQKYIEGFEKISQSPANKVFLPNNFSALFSFPTDMGGGDAQPSPPRRPRPRDEELDDEQPHFEDDDYEPEGEEV